MIRLKNEALDGTMSRARYERGFGPVVRQTTERTEELNTEELSTAEL
jgi:hypothetical protein